MTQPGDANPVFRYLRAALGPDADGPSDAELLGRFVNDRDQGAFELLVWRHAALVLRTCRGVLRDHHAAEDVAQAAFLVLARKGGSIGRRQSVASWLYRVAYRLAVRVSVRRRPDDSADLDRLPAQQPHRPDPEAIRLLHDELAKLPEKYRAPLLLCFFDGLSHADAARRLGWPVGTVAGRIARAKEYLHARLGRRGVAIPAVGAAVVAEPAFVSSTVQAATAFAAGLGVVPASPTVLELAKGAIRTMTLSKLQLSAGVLAVCGALTFGGVWATAQGPGAGPAGPPVAGFGEAPAPQPPAAAKADPADQKATSSQRRRSLNNLKQILLAFHNYEATYGHFPADIRSQDGKPLLSWRVAILPFIEQNALYRQFKLDESWDSEHNLKLLARMPDVFRVGIEPKDATHTYYQGFAGTGTAFDPNPGAVPAGFGVDGMGMGSAPGGEGLAPPGGSVAGPGTPGSAPAPAAGVPGGGGVPPPGPGVQGLAAGLPGEVAPAGPPRLRFASITDGTSNTFGVVEAGPPVPWTKPADISFDPRKPFPKLVGPFSNALHVSMLDGSAHAIRRDIEDKVMTMFVTASGGEVTEPIHQLRAPMPAETPEEKAALRDQIAKNQKLIAEIGRLLNENLALQGGKNQAVGDIIVAEQMERYLRMMIEDLNEQNRLLRGDPRPKTLLVPKK